MINAINASNQNANLHAIGIPKNITSTTTANAPAFFIESSPFNCSSIIEEYFDVIIKNRKGL